VRAVERQLGASDNVDFPAIRENLAIGIQALEQATQRMLQTIGRDPDAALGASVNYMMLTGYVCGGWQMARAALAAHARLSAVLVGLPDQELCA
jgi:3-(methylthio)propanoyl-CoA dehydrogenase